MQRLVPAWFLLWLAACAIFDQSSQASAQVSYARDVAPLLTRHCLECHGPDASQRQAGLRLDDRSSATSKLESGTIAIVAGDASSSELMRRILATGDLRMPPVDTGGGLTRQEAEKIQAWIQQGARWEVHWSFTPLKQPARPEIDDSRWPHNDIDWFVLAQLERGGLAPLKPAARHTLIRRVYLDLLGVPPAPSEVAAFINDPRPDAWPRLIDRLLSSPLYGQQFGRHWLDVARYADSNGADENHAYPLAWRYRDYVIASLNRDLPFNAFVREQIAGDLLAGDPDQHRHAAKLTATGFLALGTKILAEKDQVKMRADVVDEQIDAVGKAFLGLTLACARCHDHKFDPIETSDYYALAGILHSTQLGDQPLHTRAWRTRLARYERELKQLTQRQLKLREQLELLSEDVIQREAESFDRGNVSALDDGYGKGIGIISDPGAQKNFAEYDITLSEAGEYLIQLRYAAQDARPGRLLINGDVARPKAITEKTGGWMPEHQKWFTEGVHTLRQGKNVIRIESAPLMSHIDRIRLIRYQAGKGFATTLTQLESLDQEIIDLQKRKPQPIQVMGAREGKPHDVRIHERGSHLNLGQPVARGFPSFVSQFTQGKTPTRLKIDESQSGRLQLARWLTDHGSGAGAQSARVIVNRVWHWHFGRPLAGTPNNFGLQGHRPTHPQLLDYLAVEFIQSGWSLKSLHRQILLSATYQQSAATHPNSLYHGMPRRRLEAEVLRDCLLAHGGQLDYSLTGEPLTVTAQNPSPADLQKNEHAYRSFRRRSVYLPVVRTNVYRFLTLFDFPNAATPVGRRDETTVATQALLLMNDPLVMDQAQNLARRLIEYTPSNHDRLTNLYLRLFSRAPTKRERQLVSRFLADFEDTMGDDSSSETHTWSALCHTLLSSSEFMYVE